MKIIIIITIIRIILTFNEFWSCAFTKFTSFQQFIAKCSSVLKIIFGGTKTPLLLSIFFEISLAMPVSIYKSRS